jgi:hypothetical protein
MPEIKSKPKKCKGSGIAINFVSCGEIKPIHKFGLCFHDYCDFLLKTPEGEAYISRVSLKAKKGVQNDTKRVSKENDRKRKFESKSIAVLIQEARAPFQKLIRIRDHGKKCVCCDNNLPFNIGDFDGGHYKAAELYTGTIFHPDNCHGQRVRCNQHLHGNEALYGEGLKERIGEDRLTALIELANRTKQHKWERETLFEMKLYYEKCLKEVEKGTKHISEIDLSIGILQI